jgi:hypothetical protein
VEAVVQVVLAAVRLEVAVKSCRLPPLMLLLGRIAEDFRCASRKEEDEEEEDEDEDEAVQVRRGRVQPVVARVRSGRAAKLRVGPLLATLAKEWALLEQNVKVRRMAAVDAEDGLWMD